MREPGLAQVAAAKADGRWDAAYASQRNATVPPDLEAALESSDAAARTFGALGKSDRYAVILRLLKARTPEQRATRLGTIVAQLEEASLRLIMPDRDADARTTKRPKRPSITSCSGPCKHKPDH